MNGLFELDDSSETLEISFAEKDKKIRLIGGKQLKVLDESIRKQIQSKRLSPSTVGKLLSSPADWVMSTFIEKYIKKEIDMVDLERGHWFHSIMEDFFAKKPEYRTSAELKASINLITKTKYPHIIKNEENKEWIKNGAAKFVKVFLPEMQYDKNAKIYLNGKTQVGLEFFINGTIGNCKRGINGFIDRLSEGDNGLVIQDWKTGKTVERFDETKKISDSNNFEYFRQQIAYAILLEQKGFVVSHGELIYPFTELPEKVIINTDSQKYREKTIADFENAEKVLEESIANDFTFSFGRGRYNGYATLLCGLGNAPKPAIYEDKLTDILEVI